MWPLGERPGARAGTTRRVLSFLTAWLAFSDFSAIPASFLVPASTSLSRPSLSNTSASCQSPSRPSTMKESLQTTLTILWKVSGAASRSVLEPDGSCLGRPRFVRQLLHGCQSGRTRSSRGVTLQSDSQHTSSMAVVVIDWVMQNAPVVPESNTSDVPLETTCELGLDLMLKQELE